MPDLLTDENIMTALGKFKDPEIGRDLVSLGMVKNVEITGAHGHFNAVISHGVTMMSIQYFLTGDAPVIWRGPLIHSAIQQFLRDVEWGELDYLVVHLPPGTGDAALSLSQLIPLTGAVIVTTPQEVSLADARKAIAMFTQV